MDLESQKLSKQKFDLKEILGTYTKHWKWFLFFAIIGIIIGIVVIRYSIPEYSAQARIKIIEENSSTPSLALFQDLNILSGAPNKVEDELRIINSRSNVIQVVKNLGLNVKVESMGNIIDSEIYDKSKLPFKINLLEPDSVIYNARFHFFIQLKGENDFLYTKEEENSAERKYSFGQEIESPIGNITLTPKTEQLKGSKENKYKISINPISLMSQIYQDKIKVSAAAEFSNIINLSLQDPIQEKARDIINELIETYNGNAVADKKALADRTSEFINERINTIYSNLSSVDQTAEDFKSNRGLVDLASQTSVNLNVSAASEQELRDASIQLDIASSMKDLVDSQNGFDLLPPNVGITDPSIAANTAKYNELVSERNRILESSNEKNPVIVNIDQQLVNLKNSLKSGLNSTTNNLNLRVNSLSRQLSQANSRIYSAPSNERGLRDITRKQETTEALYLYLLQKREESQIAFASASPKSQVIDYAYNTSEFPVSPKKSIILMASLLLALFVPFSLIYVTDLLDDKVHSKVQLEKIVKGIPILAELPKLSKKEDKLIGNQDRSVLAESLRILRTNLDYIISSNKKSSPKNIIFITSSVSGEGKTFLSSNMAMVLASTQKKVLLIGADIRNPKLYTFFSEDRIHSESKHKRGKDKGLTEYLMDDTILSREIIKPTRVNENTIDIIYSGKIPPNPAELLMSERLKFLFDEMSTRYDYVIVDTAPLMVVTDTLSISDLASQIIYVTKAGVTEKKVLDFPLNLKREGKLRNISFVVNNVKESNLGYGGKYGYGYGKSIKKWWKFS